MEAYKSSCPACGATYYWTGYKTGLGKTPEQLEGMRRRQNVCRECGAEELKTTLDRESPVGQEYDEITRAQAGMIADLLKKKIEEKQDK
jgi:hypothetical protein